MSAQAVATETPLAVRAWTRLLRAHAATTRILSSQLLTEHGLTINDYEALLVLSHAEEGRMRRVDLSRRLLLTPSGVTRLLEGLEKAGLVERTSCPEDRRVAYAELTYAGRERLVEASGAHVEAVRELLETHLSARELTTLVDTLGKLPEVADGDETCSPPQ